MSQSIYLDHAAATPLDSGVFAAMQPLLVGQFYNPSAQYDAAREVKRELEAARVRVAHWFGSRPSEIVFTAGGTEANNLIIHGVMRHFPEGNIVVSAIEHDSVLEPAKQYDVRVAPVQPSGLIDLDALDKLIDDKTVLVSVQYANNEVGTVQPLRRIAQLVKEKRANRTTLPLLLHTDACQAPAYLDVHAASLGVDAITINAGKIYGPKQTGALFVKAGTVVSPQLLGGGQERGMRSGTENIANAVGLATALEIVQERRHEEVQRVQDLQRAFCKALEEKIPELIINGSRKQRLPNNVHITIPGHDNERLMMELDNRGIQCAVGSACSASSDEPSHVLKAMGLSDEAAQSSLRFTMGQGTSETDIHKVVDTLAVILS